MSPRRKAQVCKEPGCGEFRPCSKEGHESKPWSGGDQRVRERRNRELGSAKWKKTRAQVLRIWPTCYVCGVRPSTEVDHIIPDTRGGRTELENLAGICTSCHRSKSGREGRAART